MSEVPIKKCTGCGEEKPATLEYFYKHPRGKYGLKSRCKKCEIREGCERVKSQPGLAAKRSREWRERNPELNRRLAREGMRRLYARDRERIVAERREWRKSHPEYRYNPVKARESCRMYRLRNLESERERLRIYKTLHPEKQRVYTNRRRTRVKELPSTLTPNQWLRAVEYFHGCCAVCGRQANDLFGTHKLAADHWVAVSDPRPDNPGTCALNIIPLCHGEDGCNNKKHKRDSVEWLKEQYSGREVKKIMERIDSYFQWVREQDKDLAA